MDRDAPATAAAEYLQAAGRELIEGWRAAVARAGPAAVRFGLQPGQALLVDNYRMSYGQVGRGA